MGSWKISRAVLFGRNQNVYAEVELQLSNFDLTAITVFNYYSSII
jgi:hypothetical protein